MEKISRLWKMHGSIEVTDANGNKVVWLWDYANDKARLKTQMTTIIATSIYSEIINICSLNHATTY